MKIVYFHRSSRFSRRQTQVLQRF